MDNLLCVDSILRPKHIMNKIGCTGQRVTTDNMDSLIIDGITNGRYLRAHDERTGVLHELHPDGNSLDWMQGLIKKKM